MAQKIEGAQRDFSYGEIDVALKRSDEHPARKAGLRQMSNMRILNSKAIQNRPGRTPLFAAGLYGRIEEFTMSPGNVFKVAVGASALSVFNSAGSVLSFTAQGNGAALPWTLANVNQIVFAQLGLSIYITFPGMRPQVLTWDGTPGFSFGSWTVTDYNELVLGSGQKRTFFYRISPQNITLLPGAQTGSGVSLIASAPLFTAAHVGTRMRFVGRQMLITAVANSTNATVTIEEAIPGNQALVFSIDPSTTYSVGDVIIGSSSGSKAIITAINGGAKTIQAQLISTNATLVQVSYFQQNVVAFTLSDTVTGPSGGLVPATVNAIQAPQQPVALWDEEVMNAYRGYPASCFVDQFRLGFCNFPAVPGGIGWSAINSPTDCYVGGPTVPNGAIFEIAPDKAQIYYVVPGPESSEFVFCDHKIYYIKIDVQNPLRPGSVSFQILSGDGAAQVQPRIAQDVIFYVKAGGNSVMAVTAPGAYYRPFNTKNLCEFHSHLFNNVKALAAPNADGTFLERYVYALNGDGSMACGKYEVKDGQIAPEIGWGPWSGAGAVLWIAALNADVLFTTTYGSGPGETICEILDDAKYLDAAVFVNNQPASFAPPAGKGPLWWLSPLPATISLMDQGTRSMGTYQVDGNGFIVPQNNGGENLASPTLVAGFPWAAIAEPFVPDANPGADVGQRMFKRKVVRFAAYVVNSTGFLFVRLFSGPVTRTSPALGTVQGTRRVPAWNIDDDATKPPPLREEAQRWRPRGFAFDPRVAIIKDTPGPLLIAELGMESTI